MIPYGMYVLTSADEDGSVGSAAVSWVTQASFDPPLVVVCVKQDSHIHEVIEASGVFALNMLKKGQEGIAVQFFKTNPREGLTIGGQPFRFGEGGSPILERAPAYVECRVKGKLKQGDHTVFVGAVFDAGVGEEPEGRPDKAILTTSDLGGEIFYGG
jgi:flavin reductase (DIM6/NTAB) family NADH-FMN oxidoreductase RutF